MAAEKEINIEAVCRQLGYSKQAYYKSVRTKKLKTLKRSLIKQKVIAIRCEMPRIGTRKLYYMLKESFVQEGISIGRDRLFDLLREENLLVIKKKKYTKTTDSKHWMHKYPNLIQKIELTRPEQVWVADITYLSLTDKYCYLHLITDAYSKLIMGYCISESLASAATLKALQMALNNKRYESKLIHHSDRGLQYCSSAYVKILQQKDIAISMTQDGNPYDNAIAERVNGILKDEFGLDDVFKDRQQLEFQVTQSISSYNYKRPHQSNGLLTPNQMHQQNQLKPRAWHKKSARTLKGSCGFLPSPRH